MINSTSSRILEREIPVYKEAFPKLFDSDIK